MSNELKDYPAGSYISEFVSGGPKNYGYRVCSPTNSDNSCRTKKYDNIVKIHGFTLSSVVRKWIHFKSMRRMVQAFVKNGCREEFVVVTPKIERVFDVRRKVVTKYVGKKYQIVYDKRKVNCNYTTTPFGY